jgi:hypothetical protein
MSLFATGSGQIQPRGREMYCWFATGSGPSHPRGSYSRRNASLRQEFLQVDRSKYLSERRPNKPHGRNWQVASSDILAYYRGKN